MATQTKAIDVGELEARNGTVGDAVDAALARGGGLARHNGLSPCWA